MTFSRVVFLVFLSVVFGFSAGGRADKRVSSGVCLEKLGFECFRESRSE